MIRDAAKRLPKADRVTTLVCHSDIKWVSDCEKFNVPLDTDVILETSLSRQSIALALTTKTRKQNTAYILYSVNNKRETEKKLP